MPDTRRLSWIAPYSRYVEFECRRCPRKGRYALARLHARYGNITVVELLDTIGADCPQRSPGTQIYERCQMQCPTLARCYEAGAK